MAKGQDDYSRQYESIRAWDTVAALVLGVVLGLYVAKPLVEWLFP
jgi:hypothetical protein